MSTNLTSHSASSDVVICGAGMLGISTAYFLSVQMGLKNVLLIDQFPPLTLTSSKSAECYRNWWPNQTMVAFMNHSIDLLDELADSSDNVFHMNRMGYCYVTEENSKVSAFEDTVKSYASLGLGPIRIHGNDDNGEAYNPSRLGDLEKS